jgi:hypothetical protein
MCVHDVPIDQHCQQCDEERYCGNCGDPLNACVCGDTQPEDPTD